MELYITVAFWIGVVGLVVRLFVIGFGSYPRIDSKSIGNDVFIFILSASFTLWAGFLLFGGSHV